MSAACGGSAPMQAAAHRTRWPGATSRHGGRLSAQAAFRVGQRGANRQPGSRATAVAPGIWSGSDGSGWMRAVQGRHAVAQRPGIRMRRVAQHGRGGPVFDHVAGIHDAHGVAHRRSQMQVMGDQQHRGPMPRLLFLQQLHDAGLGDHVQRGGRLVRHDQARLAAERHGDQHPLALAARQFVRVAAQHRRRVGQVHRLQPCRGPVRPVVAAWDAQAGQVLAELPADRQQGVEGGERFLRDEGDLPTEQRPARRVRPARQVGALEAQAALRHPEARRQQAGHHAPDHALARAGLADQPKRLTAPEPQADVAQQRRAAGLQRDAVQFQHGLVHVSRATGAGAGPARCAARRPGS